MVRRRRIYGDFFRSLFSASHMQHVSDLHPKFHVWKYDRRQYATAKNARGNKKKEEHMHTSVLRPFFRDHPGEPMPEENFWTSWCTGRLTEADTESVRLGASPSRLISAHLHHPPRKKKKEERNHRTKIQWPAVFDRMAIITCKLVSIED